MVFQSDTMIPRPTAGVRPWPSATLAPLQVGWKKYKTKSKIVNLREPGNWHLLCQKVVWTSIDHNFDHLSDTFVILRLFTSNRHTFFVGVRVDCFFLGLRVLEVWGVLESGTWCSFVGVDFGPSVGPMHAFVWKCGIPKFESRWWCFPSRHSKTKNLGV
jgi:hypothetical protein